jgi:hypothetical protein
MISISTYAPTTWHELLALAPQLRSYEVDARSIARNASWDWYPMWVGSFAALRIDLEHVCGQHGLAYAQVHRVAVIALTDCYNVARARARQQGRRG